MKALARSSWCGAAFLLFGLWAPQVQAAVVPGDPAPEFHKTDVDGVPHTMSQYRGKVVVLFTLGFN